MKFISVFLKSIRNLLPYCLLIAIYFFFVNIEARKEKEKENFKNSEKEEIFPDAKSSTDKKNLRIRIPVTPYNK